MVQPHTAHRQTVSRSDRAGRRPFMAAVEPSAVAPTADSSDWRRLAACRDEDPELFFPVGVRGPAKAQEQAALAVCARCPVLAQCRQDALTTGDTHGVRGGMTEGDRQAVIRAKSAAKTAGAKNPANKPARKSPTRRVTATRRSA